MRQALTAIFYVMLFLVVASSAHSIWIGLTQRAAYLTAFPGAAGPLYYVTLATSAAAGVNCVFLALKQRWAIWTNIAIGLWSIALLEIVHGARMNQAIVFVACATTTVLPLLLWRRGAAAA